MLYRFGFVLSALLTTCSAANACLKDSFPELQRLDVQCRTRTVIDSAFRIIFSADARTHRIAVLAGVTQHSSLSDAANPLTASGNDIDALTKTFSDRLAFDEVIVLKDTAFTRQNLETVFRSYLPTEVMKNVDSQVLFAFSGHGSEFDGVGYLLFADAPKTDLRTYQDTLKGVLSFDDLKSILLPTMKYSHQFLALINSCKSGHFVTDKVGFGERSIQLAGAHAITAGGPKDEVHALENVGTGKGSVFFELIDAALNDTPIMLGTSSMDLPSKNGILTVFDLYSYLNKAISQVENFRVAPTFGMLLEKNPGSQEGGFFFITNRAQAEAALSKNFPQQYRSVMGSTGTEPPTLDETVWSIIDKTGSPEQVEEFIRRFPQSALVIAAKAKLGALPTPSPRSGTQSGKSNGSEISADIKWRVLLPNNSSEDAALSTYRMMQDFAGATTQASFEIARIATNASPTIFRVRSSPLSKDGASELCQEIIVKGHRCLIARDGS